MKSLGYLAVFLLSAAGMFMSLSRRQQNNDLNSTPGIANTTTDERTWDQKNRRPAKSVFFVEVPTWMRGSNSEAASEPARKPSQPVSSGLQSNPFSE